MGIDLPHQPKRIGVRGIDIVGHHQNSEGPGLTCRVQEGSDIANGGCGLIHIQRIGTQIHISVCQNTGDGPGSAPIHIAQQENVSTRDARIRIVIGGTGAGIKSNLISVAIDLGEWILIQI